MDQLTPEDRATIQRLATDGRPLSCAEIGRRLGLSRSRVQQLEKRALRKLLAAACERGICLADLFTSPGEV